MARLKWARQQALRQTGKQHAIQPTPARVSLLACLLACLPNAVGFEIAVIIRVCTPEAVLQLRGGTTGN